MLAHSSILVVMIYTYNDRFYTGAYDSRSVEEDERS